MTHIIIYYLSILTLIYMLRLLLIMRKPRHQLASLLDIRPFKAETYPKISIVVAARNEERNIEHTLKSLLHQKYPNYEIIAVNDRSTDSTEDIIERVAKENSDKLKLVSVYQLPAKWLGKNHALHKGIQEADGEYVLLTDADVVLEPHALGRALHYMTEKGCDHLAVAPDALMKEHLLNIFLCSFSLTFTIFGKPWEIKDPKKKSSIGIGAFNFFKREIYSKIGTFEKIRMRPDDDLKFGLIVKKAGFRQEIAGGHGVVKVEWYTRLSELVQGLEKNTFAAFDYQWQKVLLGCLAMFWVLVFPALGIVVMKGLIPIVCLMNFGAIFLIFRETTKKMGIPLWYGFLFPVGGALQIYILSRATWLTLKTHGINWRGTRYSLEELRANKVQW